MKLETTLELGLEEAFFSGANLILLILNKINHIVNTKECKIILNTL